MVKDSSPSGVSASLEDYLEAIFWLAQENHVARSRDIAERHETGASLEDIFLHLTGRALRDGANGAEAP